MSSAGHGPGPRRPTGTGRFRLGADRPWMPCDARQVTTAEEVARLYRMRRLVAGALPLWGWDTYRAGTGRMLGPSAW